MGFLGLLLAILVVSPVNSNPSQRICYSHKSAVGANLNASGIVCFDDHCPSKYPVNQTINSTICYNRTCIALDKTTATNISTDVNLSICFYLVPTTLTTTTVAKESVNTTATPTSHGTRNTTTPINGVNNATTTSNPAERGNTTTISTSSGRVNTTARKGNKTTTTTPISQTTSTSTEVPDNFVTTTVSYKFKGNYTTIITRYYKNKRAARDAFCEKTRTSLNIFESKFQNCGISKGSIKVAFDIHDTKENADSYISDLFKLVQSGLIKVKYNSTFEFNVITTQKIMVNGTEYSEDNGGAKDDDGGGIPKWAIALIVIGCILLCCCCGGGAASA